LKAITFDEDSGTFVGCTTTCVAVIVVLSVVPSTSAVLPLVTALDDAELVPFSYVVDDVSLTVTFWPFDVKSPKPEVETLVTLPIDPPAAGPDRALDPPLPGADIAEVDDAVVAAPEPVLAVALTMPYAPPPIAMAVAPMAMDLVSLWETMGSLPFVRGGYTECRDSR
jgi:hypothetical protein